MRFATATALLLLTAACEFGEVAAFCEQCPGGDPAMSVPKENVGRLRLLVSRRPLPANASNVQHAMYCGIDCIQFLRFDLPLADAHTFAAMVLRGEGLTTGLDPWARREMPPAITELPWWPRRFPSGFLGGSSRDASSPPADIVLVPRGTQATVWFRTFET